jgi:hypothetical protein
MVSVKPGDDNPKRTIQGALALAADARTFNKRE